MDCLQFFPH
jgi:hypothetical protein